MNSPSADIVITCYNDGAFLPDAVKSALAVEYPRKNILLVNDGSTQPDTLQILDQLSRAHPEIHRIDLPKNAGLAAARNAGIRAGSGEYILPLDSDNRLRPSYLTLAAEVLNSRPDVGVVYGYAQYFGESTGLWKPPILDIAVMLDFNQLDACSVFRRTVWESVGGYEETLFRNSWEDWDLWLSVIEKGWQFHRLEEIVFDYHKRTDSLSARSKDPAIRKELQEALFQRHAALYREHAIDVLLLKESHLAERNEKIHSLLLHVDNLHKELYDALQLQREIRWFLNIRERVKRWWKKSQRISGSDEPGSTTKG